MPANPHEVPLKSGDGSLFFLAPHPVLAVGKVRHVGEAVAVVVAERRRRRRLARNTVIESTFEVGRRFRCTMRVDCGQLDPGAVIRPVAGEWDPRMPERLDEEELADWRAGRNAVYQLAALTIGARLAVADG